MNRTEQQKPCKTVCQGVEETGQFTRAEAGGLNESDIGLK